MHYRLNKRDNQTGFVLLVCLILLQMMLMYTFTMLSLTEACQRLLQDFRQSELSEQYARQVVNLMVQRPNLLLLACQIPVTSSRVLKLKPTTWWFAPDCHISEVNRDYGYRFETLGEDPCGVIQGEMMDKALTAYYYRITLCDTKGACWQSTVILPAQYERKCEDNEHYVLPGIQMIRQI